MGQATVYIAGPMRGYVNYNFDAFHSAAKLGRSLGWRVISPAEMDLEDKVGEYERPHGGELSQDIMRELTLKDVTQIAEKCDAIALLPGWENSRGAKLEVAVALSIGLTILNALSFEPLNAQIKGYEVP